MGAALGKGRCNLMSFHCVFLGRTLEIVGPPVKR